MGPVAGDCLTVLPVVLNLGGGGEEDRLRKLPITPLSYSKENSYEQIEEHNPLRGNLIVCAWLG